MLLRLRILLSSMVVLPLVVLSGCGGASAASPGPPPPTTFQLTITGPASNTGTVTSSPAGINCPPTCSATFTQNTQITLSETPATGYAFAGWGGACSGSTSTCAITMATATAVTATFNPPVLLTVTTAGSGTVTSSPAGINCPSTCTAAFKQNTQIIFTETPATGYTFAGWGGACSGSTSTCVITIAAATAVTATFNPPLPLTVTTSGSGTVTSSPAGITCPGTCSANFPQASTVTLSETPGAGYGFAGWGGLCSSSGNNNSCAITITAAASVSASFAQLATLTVHLKGVGTGTVTSSPSGINCPGTCSASFANNTQVTLTATPTANDAFGEWSGGCTGNSSCIIAVTNSTAPSVTASFGLTLQSGINHIIFLAQENRSLDHYFGALPQYWANDGYVHYKNQPFDGLAQFPTASPAIAPPSNPGCNPADPYSPPATLSGPYQDCVYDAAAPVAAYHLQTMCVENPSPSWNESHVSMNYNDPTLNQTGVAKLDGFVWTTAHDSRSPIQLQNGTVTSQFMDTNGVRVMGYYDGDDLNYYYFMASNFATSDRWFSPVMSRTNPNREYLISATSYGFAYPNGTNSADNLQIPSPIIFEELQNAGISWKVYIYPDPQAHTYGTLQCAANDTRPQCLYQISYLHNFTYGQTIINDPTLSQNIVPISQFYTDAHNGTLPQVAQIEPASAKGLDEHAADYDPTPQKPIPCCSVQAGAAYVKTLIDAVMGTPANPSPSWKDSVFILTYDEFGGFYDHVSPQTGTQFPVPDSFSSPVDLFQGPPPAGNPGPDVCVSVGGPTCQFQYTGYRVPLIVVSPFTKQNYVSHAVADYTAILKLIEERYSVNPLTARDAAQIDMGSEFLDFVNEPWKTPPLPPPQITTGTCYLDHLP